MPGPGHVIVSVLLPLAIGLGPALKLLSSMMAKALGQKICRMCSIVSIEGKSRAVAPQADRGWG